MPEDLNTVAVPHLGQLLQERKIFLAQELRTEDGALLGSTVIADNSNRIKNWIGGGMDAL